VAQIERDRPDLVVPDLSLPGVGGLDVLRRVRDAEGDDPALGEASRTVTALTALTGGGL